MKKYRITKQRALILEVLKNSKEHPTAYQIHNVVRRKIPRISLGTVYRNLDVLCETGLIRQFKVGKMRRFDADLSDHCHIRCMSCGKVDDFPANKFDFEKSAIETDTDYMVLGYKVDFYGICGPCNDKRPMQGDYVNESMPTSN